MQKVNPPDLHYLSAAQGWLELGDPAEAGAELSRISPAHCNHPDVLEVRWEWQARQRQWEAALQTARQLLEAAPERCTGWTNQSYSLHELKRTEEAMAHLLPVIKKFPRVSTIPYNLACYSCQLGQLDQSRKWLARAMKLGGKKQTRQMALSDPDLKPLWAEIRKW